ncbi:MAG TPA: ABC transporter permease [Gammaproteobacteria bacterium]|nr:ABC transporter permease [Gammaproteobacteria bacterium]
MLCGSGTRLELHTSRTVGVSEPNQQIRFARIFGTLLATLGWFLCDVASRMNISSVVDSLSRDLRYALRGLPRRPGFTLAAVLTLALGIGATTAIFSVVYSVLIKPLPYTNAEELVRIRHSAPGINVDDLAAGSTMYLTYRDENNTLADIGLWQEDSATLIDRGESERVRALRVTGGTLRSLGVQPMQGRSFTEQEYGPTAEGPAPVILSHAFWERRFAGNEGAVGRELSIDSGPAQVVGIMPRDFRFLDMTPQPDVILSVPLIPAEQAIGNFGFQMLARLRPGVTPAEARVDLERMLPIWLDAWPIISGVAATSEAFAAMRITPLVRPLQDDLVGGIASTLWVLMGAIGAVLLVACANIANLMLVRADARRQEIAVRAALGAAPARIARELLVESLVIGVAGSLLGLVIAYGGLKLLVAIGPANLPRLHEISLSAPVLAFTVVVSLGAALAFGSVTALKLAMSIDAPKTSAARGSSASRERSATRNTLVVVQVALALMLVVSAGLMIRSFQALRDVDPGFADPATIQTAKFWMPTSLFPDPDEYTRMEREILNRIAALPGVSSAGFASILPMEGPLANGPPVGVEGQQLPPGASPVTRKPMRISPGYLGAMGTRIIAGRDMTWGDIEAGGLVALISEDFARELAPEPEGALGRRIRLPFGEDAWREVIGVVQSVHQDGLYAEPPSLVYWPVRMERFGNVPVVGTSAVTFAVRSERAGTASLMNEIRQAVNAVSGSIPIALEGTMQDLYAGSLARTSFTLVMLAIAGGMALSLGIIGIYGVIAYVVSQRAREIGIRSALGAPPWHLKRMFLLHGLGLSGVGAVVGLIAAVVLGRLMSSLLFGISPEDPVVYVAALGVILAAAALASYLPARRAARIDPTETLRAE